MSLSLTDASRDDQVAALGPWFHNLHLPDGTETAPDHPLGDFPAFKWQQVTRHLPEDLSGWTALDIGCRSEEHTSELQSLMRISYAVFCLTKKTIKTTQTRRK